MAHKLEKNIEATYKQSLSRRYNRVQLIGLPSLKDNRDLWLEEIYVPLGFTRKPGSDEERFYLPKALSESRHLVILGDPGSGKSTLVKLITHAFGRSTSSSLPQHFGPLLPIPIILRDYKVGEWNSYEDMLRSYIKQLDEEIRDSVTVEWLIEYLAKGQAIVLLDGIDEIGSVEARKHLRSLVVEPLIRKFPESYFILTSRIIGYEEAPYDNRGSKWALLKLDCERVYVAPFNDEDIEQFITRWYTARETDSAQRSEGIEALKRALQQNDRVKRLASNPSLLTLIALIFRVTADLPSGRVKLYDKITEAYLETIEKFRGVGQHPATLEQKRRWLARVGWEMQSSRTEKQEGDLLVSRKQVKKWLTEAIAEERENAEAEAETFLDYIARRSGLLIPRGVDDAGNDQFSFVHLTFQEYFAALHLRGMAWDFSEVVNHCYAHLTHRYWHETILVLFEMLAEMRGSGDRLVKVLIEKAKQPDEQQAAAEIFSELLLDSESGLNSTTQQDAAVFVLTVVCQQFDDSVIEKLKQMSPSLQSEWLGKRLIEHLKIAEPNILEPDFFLVGDEFVADWPQLVEDRLVSKQGLEAWSPNQIVPITLIGIGKQKVIEWAGRFLPLHYWLATVGYWRGITEIVTFDRERISVGAISAAELNFTSILNLVSISPWHLLLGQSMFALITSGAQIFRSCFLVPSNQKLSPYFGRSWNRTLGEYLSLSLVRLNMRSLKRSSDPYLSRYLDRSWIEEFNPGLNRELAEYMSQYLSRNLIAAISLEQLDSEAQANASNNSLLLGSAGAEWLAFQPDREENRKGAIERNRAFLKAENDWTRLLAINNLITLSAGTPELVSERNRLCDLAMQTPDKFTFPAELVEATKDKDWFNLPEIIAIIFLHEPGDPFLKPEWFDPKSEESKFFLSPPREFFALAAEVLDPKGETELGKWRKS